MTEKLWTKADAQAEIARIIESHGPGVAQGIKAIVKAVRQIGEASGHSGIAENGVDALREIVGTMGLGDMTSVERGSLLLEKVRDRLATVRGAFNATREELDKEKAWWAKALDTGTAPKPVGGGYLFGLVGKDDGNGFTAMMSPDVPFLPRYLIVDPATADGVLAEIRFSNLLMNASPHPVSLGVFNPSNWVDVEAMLKACAFDAPEVTPANRITLAGRLTKPGPFRAVLWGPSSYAVAFSGPKVGG